MIERMPYPMPSASNVCTIEGLLYFVWEREAIRICRENGHARPWTKDSVFEKYKFTNIRRKDDRVSKWIIEHLIEPNNRDPDLWFTLLIARLINWPPTLWQLIVNDVICCSINEFDSAKFVKTIEECKTRQDKVYSGAYMVYPTKLGVGGNKSQALAEHVLGDVIKHRQEIDNALWGARTVEAFVRALSSCFGLSTFMAGQVAADLTYARGQLDSAKDLYTYAPIGPGSSRGLNYLQGRKPLAGWEQGIFSLTLQGIRDKIVSELEITDLTLHDVQNVMCEYSKYCKAVLGEGTPRTLYKPELEF